MQIWNMKMKMAVIKVIYEAPQSHLWRRHDSLVSFMCGRPSCAWRASLPAPASLCRDGFAATASFYTVCDLSHQAALFVPPPTWFIFLIKLELATTAWLLAATNSKDYSLLPQINSIYKKQPPLSYSNPYSLTVFRSTKSSSMSCLEFSNYIVLKCENVVSLTNPNNKL